MGKVELVFEDRGIPVYMNIDVTHLNSLVNPRETGLAGDGYGLGLGHGIGVRIREVVVIKRLQRGRIAFQRSMLPGIDRGQDLFISAVGTERGNYEKQKSKTVFMHVVYMHTSRIAGMLSGRS
jgi:hypothetical protein